VGNSEDLAPYLKPDAGVQILNGLAVAPIDFKNAYTRANAVYFDNHVWASEYFRACHRDDTFKDRWQAAIGSSTRITTRQERDSIEGALSLMCIAVRGHS
jgi:hypothetical protein